MTHGTRSARRSQAEALATGGSTVLFATASGALSVLVPLILVSDHRSVVTVGAVVILAGVSQLAMRFATPRLMRRISDRALIAMACAAVAAAGGMALLGGGLALMAAVQLVHGIARALFWTAIQTHVVRDEASAVRGLAAVNVLGGVGLMAGPATVGWWSHPNDIASAPIVAVVLGAAGAVLALAMRAMPPFEARRGFIRSELWTRDVVLGSCMSGVAGAWRGLLDSFIPILLVALAYSESETSFLVAVSSAAIFVGAFLASPVSRLSHTPVYVVGVVLTSAVLVMLGALGRNDGLIVGAIIVGGLISGLFQTVGTAVAARSASADDRGDAVAVTGIFRSAAILAVPGIMTVMTAAVPVMSVFVISGVGMSTSLGAGLYRGKGRRHG